jgi:hypothetical protein
MRRPVLVWAPLFASPTIVGIYSCLNGIAALAIHSPNSVRNQEEKRGQVESHNP